jgi:hypothetical protein
MDVIENKIMPFIQKNKELKLKHLLDSNDT